MPTFRDHPYTRDLLSLDMPLADYAIAGSGPLFVRGWIDDPGDIDVVARRDAWTVAMRHGQPQPAPFGNVQRISVFEGDVEILNGWFPEFWPTDDLIDGADVVEGLRFVQLSVVVKTKQMLMRPRDVAHLAIIRSRGFPID
ncbi:hypothetical protein [Micromonospora aurantiaca (nom. illeg.)]|uniref:hypothetical protein n=1 Tax=Micromonospora aurantiaca (nom. illeg.) TaxID=47850 RepID=UPI003EB95DA7